VQLRKLLRDAGLRDDERAATYSIQRSVTRDQLSSPFWSFGWLVGFLRFIGFYLTTAYGLYPWLAIIEIIVLGVLVSLVSFVYFWIIWVVRKDGSHGAGIFQVYAGSD
jgi:hypothetical protein